MINRGLRSSPLFYFVFLQLTHLLPLNLTSVSSEKAYLAQALIASTAISLFFAMHTKSIPGYTKPYSSEVLGNFEPISSPFLWQKNVMKLTFLCVTDLVLKFKWKIAFPQFHCLWDEVLDIM